MVAGISKLATLPVSLPIVPLPEDVDAKQVASHFQDFLTRVIGPEAFTSNAVWRDSFALTGTFRTFYGADGISKAWRSATNETAIPEEGSLVINENAARVTALPNGSSWVDISGTFQAKTVSGLRCTCTLMVNAIPASTGSGWRIWAMRTVLEDVEGWPSVDHYEPPVLNGDAAQTFTNGHPVTNGTTIPYFDTVIIGGGQSGLSTAGRLQALGIKYIVIDSYKRIGDSWATRYDSARLHTSREYSHLPFDRTFPEGRYQEFLTKDDLAQGYQDWCTKYGVDKHIWLESRLKSGTWDNQKQQWTLNITRKGQEEKIYSRFVVMATGGGCQIPWMPGLPGREKFKGIVLHSHYYKSSKTWNGKRGIVVGSGNTAHDIAEDMYEAGLASTTMIQRSKTYVLPYEYWQALSSRLFNAQIPTALADKLQMSGPHAVGRLMLMGAVNAMARKQPERFEALERAGFLTEPYGDISWHLWERAGGHYMDVGASQKIADGKIKVKAGAPATHYTSGGLGFSDGTEIAADVIVFSTGFEIDLKESIRRFFGDDVADETDQFFGLDEEGEMRGAWKIQHPGLLSHGVSLGQSRFYSRYIALQIKAVLEGRPFKAYQGTPVPPKLVLKQTT